MSTHPHPSISCVAVMVHFKRSSGTQYIGPENCDRSGLWGREETCYKRSAGRRHADSDICFCRGLDTQLFVWSVAKPGGRVSVGSAHKEGVNGVGWWEEEGSNGGKVWSVGGDGAVKGWVVEGVE